MLNDERKLVDQDVHDGSTLIFKDLGPQVGYSTVFFWEYFGPMVVYPLFYFFRAAIYGQGEFETESIQVLAMIAWYVPEIAHSVTVGVWGSTVCFAMGNAIDARKQKL